MRDTGRNPILQRKHHRQIYLSNGLKKINPAEGAMVNSDDVPYTGAQLMRKLELKSRENFRKLYLVPALERSLIIMSIPDKPTSRNQSYIRK